MTTLAITLIVFSGVLLLVAFGVKYAHGPAAVERQKARATIGSRIVAGVSLVCMIGAFAIFAN